MRTSRQTFKLFFLPIRRKLSFFCALLCLLPLLSHSQAIITLENQPSINHFGTSTYYFEDKANTLTFEEIRQASFDKNFILANENDLNFGYTNSTIWLKLQIQNANPATNDWLLEVAYPRLDYIDFYDQTPKGDWKAVKTGNRLDFSTKVAAHRNYLFPLQLPDSSVHTYYLKFASQSSMQLPLSLSRNADFFQASMQTELLYGLFYGTLLVMALYNLFIFLSFRDISYLYYVLSIISYFSVLASISGHTYIYLWSESPWWRVNVVPIMQGFVIATACLFANSFLNTKKYVPTLHKILTFNILCGLLTSLLAIFIDNKLIVQIGAAGVAIGSLIVLLTGIICWSSGDQKARYFVIAWAVFLLGGMMLILRNAGFLPSNIMTGHAVELGSTMEVVLLSFALSDRYRLLKREKELAQAEILRVQRQYNEELEKEVIERTVQLSATNEKLNQINATKDKFFSIISHDIRGPVATVHGFLQHLVHYTDSFSKDEIRSLAERMNLSVRNLMELLDNLLEWSLSHTQNFQHNPEEVVLHQLIHHNVELFDTRAKEKEICFIVHSEEDATVFADHNMLNLVIRNLVANAVKFTNRNGNIKISACKRESDTEIVVADTGVGISKEVMDRLFKTETSNSTRGTANEKGTGLGLLLCKEFVEKNGGTIIVESELGKGASFKLTFPSSQH